MKRSTPMLLLAGAVLLSSAPLLAATKKGDPESAPTDPAATMGPTTGAHASSQATPSLKAPGKAAFAGLDKDNDGAISKAEAAGDPALAKGFDVSDEDKNGKIDAAEFARSNATGSPANVAPPPKP